MIVVIDLIEDIDYLLVVVSVGYNLEDCEVVGVVVDCNQDYYYYLYYLMGYSIDYFLVVVVVVGYN